MAKNIMVCVTQQRTCDRLIRYGHELLGSEKGDLFILHVALYDFKFLGNSEDGEALDYLYEKALAYGAQLTVIRSHNVVETLTEFAKKNKITHMILGESPEQSEDNALSRKLTAMISKNIEMIIIPS